MSDSYQSLFIPPLGFTNTGSICYFNALMQCLLSSKFFQRSARDSGDLLFQQFFESLKNNKWDNYFTTKFLESMPGGRQPNQSSSEYLLLVIEKLKIDPLFEYIHHVKRLCMSCGHVSETTDKSSDLLLNKNILEFFEHTENIDDVICDNCKTKVTIKQDRYLRSIPPLIVMSLNKYFGKTPFYYPAYFKIDIPTGKAYEGHKLPGEETSFVEYTLVATLDHIGGLGGGHYVSRILRSLPDGELSFSVNDSETAQIQGLDCVDNSYMIFYEKVV
jgi:ubiquitin C-terminal hydrolase